MKAAASRPAANWPLGSSSFVNLRGVDVPGSDAQPRYVEMRQRYVKGISTKNERRTDTCSRR